MAAPNGQSNTGNVPTGKLARWFYYLMLDIQCPDLMAQRFSAKVSATLAQLVPCTCCGKMGCKTCGTTRCHIDGRCDSLACPNRCKHDRMNECLDS